MVLTYPLPNMNAPPCMKTRTGFLAEASKDLVKILRKRQSSDPTTCPGTRYGVCTQLLPGSVASLVPSQGCTGAGARNLHPHISIISPSFPCHYYHTCFPRVVEQQKEHQGTDRMCPCYELHPACPSAFLNHLMLLQ